MHARRVIDLLVARDQLTLQAGLRTMTVFHCSLLANIQVCFLITCCCCAMTLSSDLFRHRMSSRNAFSTTNRSCLKFWRRLTPRLTWASSLPLTHNASMVRGRVGPTLVACSRVPVCACVRVGVCGCGCGCGCEWVSLLQRQPTSSLLHSLHAPRHPPLHPSQRARRPVDPANTAAMLALVLTPALVLERVLVLVLAPLA